MKDLQSLINITLEKYEKQRKYTSLVFILSIIVLLAVTAILIKPAISMTGKLVCEYEQHIHTEECVQLSCEKTEHQHSQDCYETVMESLTTFFDDDKVQMLAGAGEWFEEDELGIPTSKIDISDNLLASDSTKILEQQNSPDLENKVKIQIAFNISGDELEQIKGTQANNYTDAVQCIYYPLPKGVKFNENKIGESCRAYDKDGNLAAYYALVNGENDQSYVLFRITNEYLGNYINGSAEGGKETTFYAGALKFDATVTRGENDDGSQLIDFGKTAAGTAVTGIVSFKERKPSMTKSVKIIEDPNGLPKIEWTITINNDAKYKNLYGYILTDSMLDEAESDSIVITPEGAFDTTTDPTKWKMNIENHDTSNYPITIKYVVPISEDNLYGTGTFDSQNNAVLSKTVDGVEDSYTASAKVTVKQAGNISKSVAPDYNVDGTVDNKFIWTIDVSTNHSIPLGNFKVRDEAFKTASDIKISDGSTILSAGTDYTVDTTNGIITFGENVSQNALQITYSTDTPKTTNVITDKPKSENTAIIVYPNGKDGLASTASDIYSPYWIQKTGVYDKETKLVTWTIEISSDDYIDYGTYGKADINGLKVTDPHFVGLTNSDITVEGRARNNFEPTSNIGFNLVGDTITFTTDTSKDTTYGERIAGGAKITYKSSPSDEEKALIAAGKSTPIKNTAIIKKNSYELIAEGATNFIPSNKISKTLNTSPQSGMYDISSENSAVTLTWSVEMEQDSGYTNKEYFDYVHNYDETTKTESTEASNYMTSAQQNAIQVYAKVGKSRDWGSPLVNTDNKYYTATFYSDVTGTTEAASGADALSFRLKFTDELENAGYSFVKIVYSTTADITSVVSPTTIQFKNTSTFNGSEAWAKYTATFYASGKIPFTKVAIDKNDNEIDPDTPISLDELPTCQASIWDRTLNQRVTKKCYVFKWKIDVDNSDSFKNLTLIYTDTFQDEFTLCKNVDDYKPKLVCLDHEGKELEFGFDNYYHDEYNKPNVARFNNVSHNPNSVDYFTYYTIIPVEELEEKVEAAGEEGFTVYNSVTAKVNNTEVNYGPATAEVKVVAPVKEPEFVGPDMGDVISKGYIHQDKSLKGGNTDKGLALVQYEVDINPEGKDLANGDELIVKDQFKLGNSGYIASPCNTAGCAHNAVCTWVDNGMEQHSNVSLADAALSVLEVYEVKTDAEGNEKEVLLDDSKYSYRYYPDGVEKVNVDVDRNSNAVFNVRYRYFKAGDIVTVELTAPAGHTLKSVADGGNKVYLEIYECNNNYHNIIYTLNAENPIVFDENGKYTYTFIMPYGYDHFWFKKENDWNLENVTASNVTAVGKEVTSELHLNVPDAKHLRVKYKYSLSKNGGNFSNNDKLNFSNTAVLIGNGFSKYTSDSITLEIANSDAIVEVGYRATIKKVDISNYTLTGLNANFYLAKHDGEKWLWYQKPLTNGGALSEEADAWGTNTDYATTITAGQFEIDGLKKGNLYQLLETSTPTHDTYEYEDVSKVEPYYFSYISAPSYYPKDVDPAKVNNIQKGGMIYVTNNRLIDVKVNKNWTETQSNAQVTAELYWSYEKILNSFPAEDKMFKADAEALKVDSLQNPVTFTDSYTWDNLPNGKNGKPIYYYVKETSYKINGVETIVGTEDAEFVPVYEGNSLNDSETEIVITNVSTLQIEKIWHDADNKPMPENLIPVESIDFKLYAKVKLEDTEKPVMNGESDIFTITKADGWKYKFSADLLGEYQYFRVEEVTDGVAELAEYSISYNENYSGQTGIISVTNKSNEEIPLTTITIEKTWVDGNGNGRPSELKLTLQSKTDSTDWTDVDVEQPKPTKSDNVWTYVYENLTSINDDGDTVYYKVIEDVPEGYSLEDTNNIGITEGTIELENIRILNLELNKVWIDSTATNHDDDPVTVNIYKTTDSANFIADDSTLVQSVTIDSAGNWKKTVDKLPVYSDDSKIYYYWVEEVEVTGYTTSYIYNDGSVNSISQNDGKVVVNNESIYQTVVLPSTGGSGTKIYYVIGTALIVIGFAVYIKKNKNK